MSKQINNTIEFEMAELLYSVKSIKGFIKTPRVFSIEQLNELIHLSKSGPLGIRNHCMIVLLVTTGLRIEELRNLRISDFNPDYNLIQARGRYGQRWYIHISGHTGRLIKSYINFTFGIEINDLSEDESKHLFLFPTKSGKGSVTQKLIRSLITSVIEKSMTNSEKDKYIYRGTNKRRLAYGSNSFRHTFIFHLLQNGCSFAHISFNLAFTFLLFKISLC